MSKRWEEPSHEAARAYLHDATFRRLVDSLRALVRDGLLTEELSRQAPLMARYADQLTGARVQQERSAEQ